MQAGTRLGPYEIVARIGAGGMGEVWKARDTRLERSVAIKILPAEFAANAELKLRFEREARTISQLSHPNICTLFDVGDGYLVMELLEGETLADRIARGPLPLAEVLRYGAQIAEALDRAHRAGVVHRDLKPANVMLTKSGAKLLDFGLAKSAVIELTTDGETIQKPLTREGTILGTFQYMAPEQLEGVEADARTDIFALGAVLYEMATGLRAFDGKTKTSLIAAIVGGTPRPIRELVPLSPFALDHVIERCLAKEPQERWQSAHDISEELKWLAGAGSQSGISSVPDLGQRRRRSQITTAVAAMMTLVALAATLVAWRFWSSHETPRVMRFAAPNTITVSPGNVYGNIAISPDGTRIVYGTKSGESRMLFQRLTDQLEPKPIPGTEQASEPFFSPDGKWLGFFAHQKLMKISLAGGQPIVLTTSSYPRGAAWLPDDTIVFCPFFYGGIERVPAVGGTPVVVSKVDRKAGERSHRWPHALPGGKVILYSIGYGGSWDDATIVAQRLDTGERKVIIKGGCDARYLSTGHLVYVRGNSLYAVPFDTSKLEVRGDAVEVIQGVANHTAGGAEYAFSKNGMLVYFSPGVGMDEGGRTAIVDRHGNRIEGALPSFPVVNPRFSPDGTKISGARGNDVWTFDLVRGTSTRISSPGARTINPIWSADGSRIYYSSERSAPWQIFSRAADGSDQERRLSAEESTTANDASPDGGHLVANVVRKDTAADIVLISMNGTVRNLVQSTAEEREATFSSDGKWIAYSSDESGRPEVYVRSMGSTPGRWQISTSGGDNPRWVKQDEIVYQDGTKLLSVAVKTEPGFAAAPPQLLFERNLADYDIARDGRIVISEGPDPTRASGQINVVINWFEEIRAKMPR